MWPGSSPCLLKVTLIHSPSHWPDYIMRMCFITSLPIHYHHPAPIPDLHLCQPSTLGFRVFSSTEHTNRDTQGLGTSWEITFREASEVRFLTEALSLHSNHFMFTHQCRNQAYLQGRQKSWRWENHSQIKSPRSIQREELHLKWFARNYFPIQTPHMRLQPTAHSRPGPTPPREYLCSRQRWKRDISS